MSAKRESRVSKFPPEGDKWIKMRTVVDKIKTGVF